MNYPDALLKSTKEPSSHVFLSSFRFFSACDLYYFLDSLVYWFLRFLCVYLLISFLIICNVTQCCCNASFSGVVIRGPTWRSPRAALVKGRHIESCQKLRCAKEIK